MSPSSSSEQTRVVDLGSVIPYWRNPRRITDEAINAVMKSIEEYGYQQPITVNEDLVIIVGHTRYAALKRLGYSHASVKVVTDLTDKQVKQLRLIDNKTSELTSWNFETLVEEMEDLDAELMGRFFPEVASQVFDDIVATDTATMEMTPPPPRHEPDRNVEFVCPSCFHMWVQEIFREDVFGGRLRSANEKKETA